MQSRQAVNTKLHTVGIEVTQLFETTKTTLVSVRQCADPTLTMPKQPFFFFFKCFFFCINISTEPGVDLAQISGRLLQNKQCQY